MTKKISLLPFALLPFIFATACGNEQPAVSDQELLAALPNQPLPFAGTYSWSFKLAGFEQISSHGFFGDKINYQMQGKIHSTTYQMQQLAYDSEQQKWLGKDGKGNYYVLFFKDIKSSSMSIYKRKHQQLEPLLKFSQPPATATTDHGWNVYSKYRQQQELLPISGKYKTSTANLEVFSHYILLNNKRIKMLSYHSGERRFVGSYNNKYITIFFKSFAAPQLELAYFWFENVNQAYAINYQQVTSWQQFVKQ